MKYNSQKESQIVNYYNSGKTIREIHRITNYDRRAMRKCLIRHGIKVNSSEDICRKNFFNKRYFENIDSAEKAYWLGWLWADGNSCNTCATLNLQTRDKYVIEEFAKAISATHKVKDSFSVAPNGKRYPMSFIQLYSTEMCQDLAKVGLIPNKGKSKNIPLIPEYLVTHFIRGEFEGDGCIYDNLKCDCGKITIWDTNEICSFIKNSLSHLLKRNVGSVTKRNKVNVHVFSISKKQDIVDFYKLIYNDAEFSLKRKKDKLIKVVDKILKSNNRDGYSSKYKGVWKSGKKFEACIGSRKNRIRKRFDTEIEAANWYKEINKYENITK